MSTIIRRLRLSPPRLARNAKSPRSRYSTANGSEAASSQSSGGIPVSRALAATISASFAAYTLGTMYPPQFVNLLYPQPAPAPPSNPDSPSSIAHIAEIEDRLQNLSLVRSLRHAPDATEWYETRPYLKYPEAQRVNSLTAGALRGPGKLAVPPLLRVKHDETESIAVLHFGRGLCGHDGIIHGGLIATVLDEGLGRLAIMNVPEKLAVTANLTVEYKAPTRADQFVVLRTKIVTLEGRKAQVEGRLEDLDGNLLATAKALFIQPKYAKLLNKTAIRQAMGEPQLGRSSIPQLPDAQIPPTATALPGTPVQA
ncbi:Thioesterase/thiol ester dehydrase-isomerase [Schizopora paradoxa]|uniref:Thioesterase/thiol ester dehydrase-isomerase n=1 Tax=Schizopora paradoxa TaxID=27342 RepID=A0A0H2RD98_9AGAM|nr:Thioesterase/thiol ester dehydrase-isomerase [Schizopora paradoxa]